MWNTSWPVNLYLIIPTSKELADVEKAFMYNLHDFCLLRANPSFELQINTLHPNFYSARALMWDTESEYVTNNVIPFVLAKWRLWKARHNEKLDIMLSVHQNPDSHTNGVYFWTRFVQAKRMFTHSQAKKTLHIHFSDPLWYYLNRKFRLCWTSMPRERWELPTGATAQNWINFLQQCLQQQNCPREIPIWING